MPLAGAPDLLDSFPSRGATRALDAEGVEALAGLLRSAAEAPAHCNAVTALGWSGRAEAVTALIEYTAAAARDELERARYCALTRVPLALGHLARSDDRALAWLLAAAAAGARDPGWHFGRQRGQRLALLLDEQVRTGLALSGRSEATRGLARGAGGRRFGARRGRRAARARLRHSGRCGAGPSARLWMGADAALASPTYAGSLMRRVRSCCSALASALAARRPRARRRSPICPRSVSCRGRPDDDARRLSTTRL